MKLLILFPIRQKPEIITTRPNFWSQVAQDIGKVRRGRKRRQQFSKVSFKIRQFKTLAEMYKQYFKTNSEQNENKWVKIQPIQLLDMKHVHCNKTLADGIQLGWDPLKNKPVRLGMVAHLKGRGMRISMSLRSALSQKTQPN